MEFDEDNDRTDIFIPNLHQYQCGGRTKVVIKRQMAGGLRRGVGL